MLNEQLKRQITKDAEEYNNQFKHGTGFREPAFFDGATKYASKWQEEKELRERYEKALKEIAGYSGLVPPKQGMIDIAREALTPKTGSDE